MKKSFMTRVLATGLSLAMAFSMAAATNVTTASAASKPAMITYDSGASAKTLSVKLGEATKIKVNAATKKTYKVSAVKVSSSKLRAAKNTAGTVVTIRGLKATEEGKPASVKVSFKVKKTGKASKYSYVSKVNVIEDKLTMTAEATGVKTITVNFNKAIEDASKVKVTVKKGATAKDCTATVDGSKITLAMDTKLIAGTYTVSVEGVAETAMTADVVVEKDETLTTFEISPNLTMATSTATDSAICYYSALNQYGEPMTTDTPDVSSSFSSKTVISRVATASVKGKISITEIPTVLAIQGTTGTIVLVDKNTGVNTSATVTVSAAATASEATVVGTYNTASSKIESITAGANLGNYYILLSIKDQYGDDVSADDFAGVANISLAGGLTKVALSDPNNMNNTLTSITVDGTEYVAIKLATATAVAGTYTMTIVNTKKGLLSSGTYEVADSVVVSSVSIAPKNGAYNNTDNEMEYSIIDKDGKEVTSYAVLKSLVDVENSKWEKNSDGTAKLVYTPSVSISGTSDTASTLDTVVVKANEPTSTNYIVKTFTFTVSKERKIKTAQGLASGVSTSVAINNKLEIALNKIIYADQYSNKVTSDDTAIYASNVKIGAIDANATGCSIRIDPIDGAFDAVAGISADGKKLEFQSTKAGTANVYLKYSDKESSPVSATTTNYDFKFTVTATDTGSVAASSLKINSVNGGFTVSGSGIALTPSDIEVVGTIGGAQTKIPTSQYVVKSISNNSFTDAEKNAGTKTKTATVTVQVTTWDANNNPTETELTADYQVSVEGASVYKLIGTDATQLTSATKNAAVTAGALQKCFTFEDQYNTNSSAGVAATTILGAGKIAGNVTYDINVVNGATDSYRVTGGGTNGASIVFTKSGTYTVKVTATVNGASKTVTLTVAVA